MSDREEKAIGDLKRNFVHRSPNRQRHVKFSASEVSGNIALAYYRGLAESQKQIDYWKKRYHKLKAKFKSI